jgi:acyl-CoA reductase-like NAD-dependent aldehyde dehydrogenase
MPRVAANFRFFADHLLRLRHEDFRTRGHRNHVSYDPAGVTAVLTPWNAPLMLATWRIAPALAAGNTVVLKPPEWAPLTASLLADIARTITLEPGDLLFSGTPANSRPVQPGDVVEVLVEGLGRLTNHIVEGPAAIRADVGAQPTESEEVRSTALGGDWEFRGIRGPRR